MAANSAGVVAGGGVRRRYGGARRVCGGRDSAG